MERISTKWYQNDAHAFVLERQDESLDEGNAPVLAHGTKAGCDALSITPIFENVAPELPALVGEGIFRVSTGAIHGTFEKTLNRS